MNNIDNLIIELMNKIANQGIDSDKMQMINMIASTIIEENIFSNKINEFVIFISFYELTGMVKIHLDEIKSRIIRKSLGSEYMHGMIISKYPLTKMSKSISTKLENIEVYEDGYVRRETIRSIQNPEENHNTYILNDYGKLALK